MRLEACGVDKLRERQKPGGSYGVPWLGKGQNVPLQKPVVEAGLEGAYTIGQDSGLCVWVFVFTSHKQVDLK